MVLATSLINEFKNNNYNSILKDLYVDEHLLDYQKNRYIQAIENGNTCKPAGALYFPFRNEWAESKKKALESYKNKGYLLKDETVLEKMDSDLYGSNTSNSLPVRFIKSKAASKDSQEREFGAEGNLLTEKQFEDITKYIDEIGRQN